MFRYRLEQLQLKNSIKLSIDVRRLLGHALESVNNIISRNSRWIADSGHISSIQLSAGRSSLYAIIARVKDAPLCAPTYLCIPGMHQAKASFITTGTASATMQPALQKFGINRSSINNDTIDLTSSSIFRTLIDGLPYKQGAHPAPTPRHTLFLFVFCPCRKRSSFDLQSILQ